MPFNKKFLNEVVDSEFLSTFPIHLPRFALYWILAFSLSFPQHCTRMASLSYHVTYERIGCDEKYRSKVPKIGTFFVRST